MATYLLYQHAETKLHYAVDLDGHINAPSILLYAGTWQPSARWAAGAVVTDTERFVLVARNVVFKDGAC